MKKVLFILLLLLSGAAVQINAQVTVGTKKVPENYSALEIISNGSNALRLPQVTTVQRDAIAVSGKMLAEGLVVFNTTTKCIDYWNGSKWVGLCLGSAKINLNDDTSGNYHLNGKTCFDVKQGNDNAACGLLSSRTDDFAATKSFSYTFTGSTYSNLSFQVIDDNLLLSNTSASGSTFTLIFRDDINTVVAGTDKTAAKKLTVVARYRDSSNAEKQLTLTVSVQDCGCN